jgi:hypothetical protein
MTTPSDVATMTTIGRSRDQEAHQRLTDLVNAIDRGDHDHELKLLTVNARKRRPLDQRGARPLPAGRLAGRDLMTRLVNGWYSADWTAMDLILEAVAARQATLRNAELAATNARLQAEAPTLHGGERVRVRLDAPLRETHKVLLGRTGTVGKVNTATAWVQFDPDQPLGKFGNQAQVKCPIELLEILPPDTRFDLGAADTAILLGLVAREAARLLDEDTPELSSQLEGLERRLWAHKREVDA